MNDMIRVLIFIVGLLGAVVGVYAGITVVSVFRKRFEGGSPSPALPPEELDVMNARLAAVELLEARVAELEERLDFAERLLARAQEPVALQSGSPLERR